MTLPLYLLDPPALDAVVAGDELELGGDEGRHAATVQTIDVRRVSDSTQSTTS